MNKADHRGKSGRAPSRIGGGWDSAFASDALVNTPPLASFPRCRASSASGDGRAPARTTSAAVPPVARIPGRLPTASGKTPERNRTQSSSIELNRAQCRRMTPQSRGVSALRRLGICVLNLSALSAMRFINGQVRHAPNSSRCRCPDNKPLGPSGCR